MANGEFMAPRLALPSLLLFYIGSSPTHEHTDAFPSFALLSFSFLRASLCPTVTLENYCRIPCPYVGRWLNLCRCVCKSSDECVGISSITTRFTASARRRVDADVESGISRFCDLISKLETLDLRREGYFASLSGIIMRARKFARGETRKIWRISDDDETCIDFEFMAVYGYVGYSRDSIQRVNKMVLLSLTCIIKWILFYSRLHFSKY